MPAKKQNYTIAEIKAGVFVLASLVVLFGFIIVVSRINLAPPETKSFHTYFTGTLGLNPNAEVRYGGLRVGNVTDIRYAVDSESERAEFAAREAEAGQRLIRVDFEILTNVPLNSESEASVQQTTFTAERHLELTVGTPGAALLEPGAIVMALNQNYGFIQLPDTAAVLGEVERLLRDVRALLGVADAQNTPPDTEGAVKPEQFQVTRIAATIKNLLEDLDSFLGVDDAVAKEAQGEEFVRLTGITLSVKNTLEYLQGGLFEEERIAGLLDEAKKLLEQLNGTLAENRTPIHNAITGAEGVMGDVGEVSDTVVALVNDLAPRLAEIAETLQSLLTNADGLTGTARDFVEDNRPVIEDVLADLGETVGYLKTFSRTMAEQPQAVIRGKEAEGRKK